MIRSDITQPLSGIILDFEDIDHGSEEIFMANTFNDSISFNELPDLNFFITSEKNSLGILLNEWMDGDELSIKIERVKKTKSF